MAQVAIITRTKDRPLLLHRAALSVINQSFQDWVWVVVNDGGEPSAVTEVLNRHSKSLQGRILRIDHPSSLGMEAASNAGIRASDSRFLVIHDDDDSWEPSFLDVTVNLLYSRPHPLVRAAVTHCTEIKERIEGDVVRELSRQSYNSHLTNLTLLGFLRENRTPPICFLYERDVHNEIGYYDEEMSVLGDWDFFLRFYQHYEGLIVRRHLANYHIRPTQSHGTYGNSVTAGIDLHAFYGQLLWNKFLRIDLMAGRTGIGTLAATVQAVEIASRRLDYPLSFLAPALEARASGHNEVIICGAGIAGIRAAQFARMLGLKIRCFTDRNPDFHGNLFDGVPVHSLKAGLATGLPCIVGSLGFAEEIRNEIEMLSLELNLAAPSIYCPKNLV
jgi:glycosyltransferase involved in cell wall biosynthesis